MQEYIMKFFRQIAYVFFPFLFKWKETIMFKTDLDSSHFKIGCYKIGKCWYEIRRDDNYLFFKRVETPLLMGCKEKIRFRLEFIKAESGTILNIEFNADLYTKIFSMVFFIIVIIINFFILIADPKSVGPKYLSDIVPFIFLFVPSISFHQTHRSAITRDVISDLKTICK
jgi:hypothetical protein